MKGSKSKQKTKEKKKTNNIYNKNSSLKETKTSPSENKFNKNEVNKKKVVKKENVNSQNCDFYNKIESPKNYKNDDLNKYVKVDTHEKYFSCNFDKKKKRNSISQDLIEKILEINNKESSLKYDSSYFFLHQKEEAFSNNINSIINGNNNPNFIEYIEESKISNKKNGNNKVQKYKNIKQNISKNKNNINLIRGVGTQDFKYINLRLDSSNSFTDRQSDKKYKYNSSLTDKMRSHVKKTDILFGLHQISGTSSNKQLSFLSSQNNKLPPSQISESKYSSMTKRQKEIAQNLIELDLNKLEKEVYEYENTDVTDAINKLPTIQFNSDKNKNNRKNKQIMKHFKSKNDKRKKIKKCIKNIQERFRILRHTGYVYDSLDDEECEDEEDNNFYFEPNDNFIFILDFIILISSLFYLIFHPIYLSISPFNEKNVIKDFVFIFIDIIFIIDFNSGFFKAYINFDEDLIKNSKLIIKNYVKTWFLLDFLCNIPVYSVLKLLKKKFENNKCYESCYYNYNGKNLYRLFELVKLLKIIKVFKANTAQKKIKRKLKKISFFYYWEHFIKQIFLFISILNLSTCLFIFSGRNNYPNWILNSNMNINNFITTYICSLYYIITTITTVGYGDVQIFSMTERIFEILFLIIGTCFYSWMLTYISNYIKKMSEKNLKFEQKLEILDDIKANYPLMNNDLYRRVYKLLYYKKSHQEVDKNIIINSLPYSIRNNLLIQMYYPIITNFKFFKYFGNSEFIIEIVSVLKPLVCLKGDLLINEGDYVEDIILNKSGILSLEIGIDLNNTREFIEQYLNKYNLESIKNKTNIDSNIVFSSIYKKNSLSSSSYSKSTFNFNKLSNSIIKSNNNTNFLASIKREKSTLDIEKMKQNKYQYLKIINIREKEHFGDVLMFLNEPSPLNVRVNSKNAEVLLLNKADVVKISSNFPNIWNRINENSVFNLEQIKNLIMRKLSIFCCSNDIKIKSLYCKKDTKTGQNKIIYSLIPIPDSTMNKRSNKSINLNNENNSKNSENNSPKNYTNSKEKNTFIINEVQSSEESKVSNIFTKEIRYSYKNNTLSKKRKSKKLSNNIKISNQREFSSDENFHNKKINTHSDQNLIENQNNQFLTCFHYRSYSNHCQKKNSISSCKYAKNSIKSALYKINNNIIYNENNSTKNSRRKSNLTNNLIVNNVLNNSVTSSSKGLIRYQTFADKSKMNKRLLSISSFNFMQNYDNCCSDQRSENVNDEIYSNENFEIKIPDNDQNLIINNNNELKENLISDCPETSKNIILITSKKNHENSDNIKEEKKNTDSNNLNLNKKFNNLQIYSMSTIEIKSSYDNINEFTKYKFISDESLIKKTKIFLSKECGFLCEINKKYINISYQSPNSGEIKSQSSMKLSKYFRNNKSCDYNNINNLSLLHDNDTHSPLPFSKELEKIGIKKTKKNNRNFLGDSLKNIKELNKSFGKIKRNSTIKEENELFRKGNLTTKNLFSSFSPKKGRKKGDMSSEVSKKTRNRLDLITKNMERDNQNLNNPNEFYADLFKTFYKIKMRKKGSVSSMPKMKEIQSSIAKDSMKKNKEEDKNILEDN